MKEILFRGKRVDNGEWVEGDLCRTPEDGCCIVSLFTYEEMDVGYKDYISSHIVVDPLTVGQFTGKIVSDNKKLFEGHLIKYFSSVEFNEWDICSIEWDDDNCKFVLHYVDRNEYEDLDGTQLYCRMEIIGNIHNKEPQ
jgi:uncharacterized phage protein (TIGR01671 family)